MKKLKKNVVNNGSLYNTQKETRWDRIRKKCNYGSALSFPLNSDAVRRFIDKDYIGKRNTSALKGESKTISVLNPAVVMDLRHQMFQKMPRKLPIATVANEMQKNLQSCSEHNLAVEERFIDNELKKLREQLEKNRERVKVKFAKKFAETDALCVDNKPIIDSLESTSKHIHDFYTAPLDAMNKVDSLTGDRKDKKPSLQLYQTKIDVKDFLTNEDELMAKVLKSPEDYRTQKYGIPLLGAPAESNNGQRTPSPLTTTEEFMNMLREAADNHRPGNRRVHFEDELKAQKPERAGSSCSNTSDGLDSIISDLAEEALYELQMEEQEFLKKAERDSYRKSEIVDTIEQTPFMEKRERTSPLAVVGESATNYEDERNILVIRKITYQPPPKEPIHRLLASSDDEEQVHEQDLIIEQLFKSRAQTSISTMRKYFLKWIHYTTISKLERESMTRKPDRVHQINAFLDKLRKEKVRVSKTPQAPPNNAEASCTSSQTTVQSKDNVQITKKYHNKIKMQQDIIELQRLKLERQDRLIMELKMKKLSDEAKDARQEIKNELKAVIRTGDEKSKAKAKCLQLIGNFREAEDDNDFKRLQVKSLLMPKFMQRMQERALERSIRHEQARQRRLQQEAEREALRLAAEEAKRREDEEAKRMRIEALKEKRRMEKMAKVLREREHQRMMENKRKAMDFARRRLLRRIGMEGFKRLIERKRVYVQKSETLKRKVVKRSAFVAWRDFYHFELTRRVHKADTLRSVLVQRNAFYVWRQCVAKERSKYYVAADWYDMKLSTYMFKEWLAYTQRMKTIEKSKMRKAISHHEWTLKFKVLDCWQRLPQILRLERETEERRERWRYKIWELLPDYTPRHNLF